MLTSVPLSRRLIRFARLDPGASILCGRENFVTGRLVVLQVIHGLPKGGELFVHAVAGSTLVAEGTVLRNAVPGIKRKDAGKCDLLRRIELLFGYVQDRNRDTR